MKFSKVYSAQPHNLSGHIVSVEVDISRGLHAFSIVGMASRSVDESRDRVGSAIKNSGYTSPKSKNEKLVVSLAPAELKKDGAYYDLAIALGYLLSADEISFDPSSSIFIGELSLDGSLKSLRGVLPIVQAAKDYGFKSVFLPAQNAEEAALVDGIDIYPVTTLNQAIDHINTYKEHQTLIAPQAVTSVDSHMQCHHVDFGDIKGQDIVKRGLEIAAAGGHNVAMFGPPGTGKTMLARAFSSILPGLSREQVLEITGIHSVAGTLDGHVMVDVPVRSPHHTSSYVAIIGGGTNPKPGEITLAHHGVLFLDEFPEFDKKVLESLRQPLEDRVVTISRAQGTVTFPASFMLVAAMNPCPCGFYGSEKKTCICSAHDIMRYKKKVSGPIIDRIDIWLPVEHIDYEELSGNQQVSEKISPSICSRVQAARDFGVQRRGSRGLNVEMSSRDIQVEPMSTEVTKLLNQSAEKLQLSPRAYHRVIKLARTIADLSASLEIQSDHILEALQYRPQV